MTRTSGPWLRTAVSGAASAGLVGAALVGAPAVLAAAPASAADTGRTLYVSSTGDDTADGLTAGSAWRTVGRVSAEVLAPGDRALFEGGSTFAGRLYLDPADAGDPTRPVVIGSFGGGRATLASTGSGGVVVYDTAGVEVRGLVLKGHPDAYRTAPGITAYNDLPGRRLAHLVVADVDVSGFRSGIEIGGGAVGSGFTDVRVTSSSVHDNRDVGLLTYGTAFDAAAPGYAHHRVRVAGVSAYRNVGDPANLVRNTGSGIVLGSVREGTVEGSRAYENGSACSAPEGPVGIWTYDSDRVVLQRNVSHHNRTGGSADGGGFDLDQNVSGSVMQHNLSYANDGPGYLVYTAADNSAHRGNVVRFNLSSGDAGRSSYYGAITVSGRVGGTQVHNNTVVVRARGTVRPPAVKLSGALSGVAVRNNVLVSDAAGPLVTSTTGGALLQGNAYHATSASAWQVRWRGLTYGSLASWRTATRQETVGGRPTGTSVDPQLVDPAAPLAVTDPADTAGAAALGLRPTSPLVGAGLALGPLFGVDVGSRDYFGNAVPLTGPSDVGAHHPLR